MGETLLEGMYSHFSTIGAWRWVMVQPNQAGMDMRCFYVVVDTDIGYKSADNIVYDYLDVDIFISARGFGVYKSQLNWIWGAI